MIDYAMHFCFVLSEGEKNSSRVRRGTSKKPDLSNSRSSHSRGKSRRGCMEPACPLHGHDKPQKGEKCAANQTARPVGNQGKILPRSGNR